MIQLGNLEAKPWLRGARGSFGKHAPKTNITDRDKWDWSLSNCALGKIYGMSPQAVRKTRLSLKKDTFHKPRPKKKIFGPWINGPTAPTECSLECITGRAKFGKAPRDINERFWEKVTKAGIGECWEWNGSKDMSGYGQIFIGVLGKNRKNHKAHRIAYMLENGSIPAGYVVRHRCDNKSCCNPNHLELGFPVHNMRDAVERQKLNQGEKNGNSVFTADDVREMRRLYDLGERPYLIAKKFNTIGSTVSAIVKRKSWRHV